MYVYCSLLLEMEQLNGITNARNELNYLLEMIET